jgi:transposase-like protein
MLKDSEISRYSARRTHRTYTPHFKAELVAACQKPGMSIAALAGQHGMNANVLHRWLKEHERSGRHALTEQHVLKNPERPAFVALALPTPKVPNQSQDIRVVLSKGALTINVSWPMHAVADLASWTTAILK